MEIKQTYTGRCCITVLLLFVLLLGRTFTLVAQNRTVDIWVDCKPTSQKIFPIWNWFGYDEPNYTYMKDGKKLLAKIAKFDKATPVYIRCHNLMTTGNGVPALKWGSTNLYTEDSLGNPIYTWNIVDSIFDTYVRLGMKPLVQIGFMPEALSIHPQPYQHNWQPGNKYADIGTGWAYPPKDYNKWRTLVYEWAKHCLKRYGQKVVETWYWEVWNEPNNGPYWKSTADNFYKLYDYAADGLKKAIPNAKIGGCNVTGGGSKYLKAFIDHCIKDTNYATGKIGSPLDILLFHAKGSPRFNNNVVRMNMSNQLKHINDNMQMIAAYPAVKNLPIIIGESDPEGCAACGETTNPENAYRNGTMFSSYTAAVFPRKYLLAEKHASNLIGAVTWSFEFENQPWFAGFRDLATNGIDKPVLHVFNMFAKLKGYLLPAYSSDMYSLKQVLDSSIRNKTDVGVFASRQNNHAWILLWNYHDEDIKDDTAFIQLSIKNLPATSVKVKEYRIDQTHANSYTAWLAMGKPQQPTAAQIVQLEQASLLQNIHDNTPLSVKNQQTQLFIQLPRQGVSLLHVSW